ncbi:MAG: hypothetical protein M3Q32_09175 [Pseudomonadota bacterium]|nr:hypothetical protein [Burkholderiales bacterium]MDQ3196508.1 hypothetical protein [Pseudomonadota bacterium]
MKSLKAAAYTGAAKVFVDGALATGAAVVVSLDFDDESGIVRLDASSAAAGRGD